MANVASIKVGFRKVPNHPNVFEFTVTAPLLRVQFRIHRSIVNRLRVDLERALMEK